MLLRRNTRQAKIKLKKEISKLSFLDLNCATIKSLITLIKFELKVNLIYKCYLKMYSYILKVLLLNNEIG